MTFTNERYRELRDIFKGQRLPLAFVDPGTFDANLAGLCGGQGQQRRQNDPIPVLPVGMQYLPLEGTGEVHSPLRLAKGTPESEPGDPVFFQHAKAGELCERFNELDLLKGGEIVGHTRTYRGE